MFYAMFTQVYTVWNDNTWLYTYADVNDNKFLIHCQLCCIFFPYLVFIMVLWKLQVIGVLVIVKFAIENQIKPDNEEISSVKIKHLNVLFKKTTIQ